MFKFKVSGTYNGERRSAEVTANSKDEAVMKITQKFVGFVVKEVTRLDKPNPFAPVDTASPIPPASDQFVEEADPMPVVGSVQTTLLNPNKNEQDSAQRFIYSCDQFIRLVRILSWIVVALYVLLATGTALDSGYLDFTGFMFGVFAIFVVVVIAYAVIEFQVLFLRFMRESVNQLNEIRASRNTD